MEPVQGESGKIARLMERDRNRSNRGCDHEPEGESGRGARGREDEHHHHQSREPRSELTDRHHHGAMTSTRSPGNRLHTGTTPDRVASATVMPPPPPSRTAAMPMTPGAAPSGTATGVQAFERTTCCTMPAASTLTVSRSGSMLSVRMI